MVLRSIILRRKVWPAGTTLAAKLKVPMRDKSSCLVLCVRPEHSSSDEWMSWSLSGGSVASREAESKRMPRYSRQVVGPSSFQPGDAQGPTEGGEGVEVLGTLG